MKYCSTRGKDRNLSFEEVLFAGYSSDGGLFMPESIPKLSQEEIKSWSKLTYQEIVFKTSRTFISKDEIPDEDLQGILDSAYKKFSDQEKLLSLVDVSQLSKSGKLLGPLYVLELFHGPTFAFKDLALSYVAGLLEYFNTKRKRHVTILVGTSGDTGGAAISAIEGRSYMDLIVLLPRHSCSEPQLLQMTTSEYQNITTYSVDGTSDDLDIPVKQCFASEEFVKKHSLMCINSINWGRILGQIAHFYFAYFTLLGDDLSKELEVVIPTGAAGNITSGAIAQAMGLPIRLTAAVNTNDIVARTIREGDFSRVGEVKSTLSSAMDIQIPYNVERLFYIFSGLNFDKVRAIMDDFELKGRARVPDDVMKNMKAALRDTCTYDDSKTLDITGKVYKTSGYLLCPHTAVGVGYHFDNPTLSPRVFVATASPAKFPETIKRALSGPGGGEEKKVEEVVRKLNEPLNSLRNKKRKELGMEQGEDWLSILKEKIEEIKKRGSN